MTYRDGSVWGLLCSLGPTGEHQLNPTPPTPSAPPTRGSALWAPSALTAMQLFPGPRKPGHASEGSTVPMPQPFHGALSGLQQGGGVTCEESPEALTFRPLSQKVLDSRRQQGLGRRVSGRRTPSLDPYHPGTDNCWAGGRWLWHPVLVHHGPRSPKPSQGYLGPEWGARRECHLMPPSLSLVKAPHHPPG